MSVEVWIVGSETDDSLFKSLGEALRSLGYRLDSEWSAVAGSQDISHWELEGPNGSLVVESETYVGLSVSGSPELLRAIQLEFQRVLPANHSLQGRRP